MKFSTNNLAYLKLLIRHVSELNTKTQMMRYEKQFNKSQYALIFII